MGQRMLGGCGGHLVLCGMPKRDDPQKGAWARPTGTMMDRMRMLGPRFFRGLARGYRIEKSAAR